MFKAILLAAMAALTFTSTAMAETRVVRKEVTVQRDVYVHRDRLDRERHYERRQRQHVNRGNHYGHYKQHHRRAHKPYHRTHRDYTHHDRYDYRRRDHRGDRHY